MFCCLVPIDPSTILRAESVCIEKCTFLSLKKKNICFVAVVAQRIRVSHRNKEIGIQLFLT